MSEKSIAEKIAEELLKERKEDDKAGEKKESAIKPPIKKEAKIDPKVKSPPIKPKLYYDVKVETMLPATLTFRVLAEDPAQAIDLIRGMNPTNVRHRLVGRRDIKATVYEAGTTMIKWVKNLIGM